MTLPLRFGAAPPMWELVPAGQGDACDTVRIANRSVPVASIKSVTGQRHIERDAAGILIMGLISIVLGLVLFAGVAHFDWSLHNLIGTLLLCGLGAASVREGFAAEDVFYWQLRIETHDGEVIFTTADATDAAALRQALDGV